jgi:hypothetical protein
MRTSTKKGTHLLLQARENVLNGDWENEFRKIVAKYMPIKLANDQEELKTVALLAQASRLLLCYRLLVSYIT